MKKIIDFSCTFFFYFLSSKLYSRPYFFFPPSSWLVFLFCSLLCCDFLLSFGGGRLHCSWYIQGRLIRTMCVSVCDSITDPPNVSLAMGRSLNAEGIKAGDDVYFDCHVTARPSAVRLVWRHQVRLSFSFILLYLFSVIIIWTTNVLSK